MRVSVDLQGSIWEDPSPDKLGQDRTDLQMEVVCPVTRPASGPISLFHLVRRLQEESRSAFGALASCSG